MEERALKFLREHGEKLLILDDKDLDLAGFDEKMVL